MMTDVRHYTRAQYDLVAAWQLSGCGWSRAKIMHEARRWQLVHDGVFAIGHAPLTREQLWMAATLTAPDTHLYAASGAGCWGFRAWEGSFETVVRPGNGGPRRFGDVLVLRSKLLAGRTTVHRGIPIVRAPWVLISLAPHLPRYQMARAFREACRLRTTTANEIAKALKGQRGSRVLADRCDRYATIPYHRCRSDAESRALEILHDAGVPAPQVNVRVGRGGPEADLVWRSHRCIIEVDGDQFHQDKAEDARKEAIWQGAGYRVERVSSDDVYFRPEKLVTLANVLLGRL